MAVPQAGVSEPVALDPGHIMQIGMGFAISKALLSAVELGIFTELGDGPVGGPAIIQLLGLQERPGFDLLDGLVSVGLLQREGGGPDALYSNTAQTQAFLDKKSPQYIGGILEMANARLYGFWDGLTEALRTGRPQNEIKTTGAPMFEELYREPERLEQFMNAMTGISAGGFHALAETFDFSRYNTLLDVGGATAQLSCIVAARHPHITGRSFDLPPVQPIAQRRIESEGLTGRVEAVTGDFFAGPLPKADVITMGLILHDWNLEKKMQLIRAAYEALPPGGALVAIDNLIDDDRRRNTFGMMMSLNMLIEFGDAFDYTGAEFENWCSQVGFSTVETLHLAGPTSAAIAYK